MEFRQEKESSISRITGYSDRHSDVWPRPSSGKDLLPLTVLTAVSSCRLPQDLRSRADPLTWCQGYTEQDRRPSHRSPPWMGNTHPLGYHQVDQGFVGADSQARQSVRSILLLMFFPLTGEDPWETPRAPDFTLASASGESRVWQ